VTLPAGAVPGAAPAASTSAPARTGAAPAGPAPSAGEPGALLTRLQQAIGRTVIGYDDPIRALTIALACEGHVLVEGLPGLAKTYLVRSFARALDLSFHRIQFTPDLLPLDIVGNVILDPKNQQFEFRPGPIFANIVLADEINRAPPKVQSALLEAMQEFQVTVDGRSYPLPRPFLVIATQNPLDQEGTYPLPESQLDRFLFREVLQYPAAHDEMRILETQGAGTVPAEPRQVVSADEVTELRAALRATYVHPDILQYVAAIVRETRRDPKILVGASPRAGVHLTLAARAAAALDRRSYVIPDDVQELAYPVLNHRIVVRPEAMRTATPTDRSAGSSAVLRGVLEAVLARSNAPR